MNNYEKTQLRLETEQVLTYVTMSVINVYKKF